MSVFSDSLCDSCRKRMSNTFCHSIFKDVWTKLVSDLKRVYHLQGIQSQECSELYTHGYNYYTSNSVRLTESRALTTVTDGQIYFAKEIFTTGELILEGDLYLHLENYITDHLEQLIQNNNGMCNKNTLRFFANHWKQYRVLIKYLRHTCSYLYRHYIRVAYCARNKQMYQIFIFCILLWRTIIGVLLNKIMAQSCLDLINTERNNELSDSVIQRYVTVDSNEMIMTISNKQTNTTILRFNDNAFEASILQDIEQFYQMEATSLFEQSSIIKYIKKVYQRLNGSRLCIDSYLHIPTMHLLFTKIEEIFTGSHLDIMRGELKMLRLYKNDPDHWSLNYIGTNELNSRPRSRPRITWKHSWPVNQIRDALSESPFFRIPNEILFQILQLLSTRDLGNVSLVCRFFKMIASQDEIWQLKCNTSHKLRSKSFKEIYMDWIYEKYLCDRDLNKSFFGLWCLCCRPIRPWLFYTSIFSSEYPVRSVHKVQASCVSGFNEHPDSSQNMTIQLSVDINRTAEELMFLLKKASEFQPNWCQSRIVKQMIMRYYRFMQLKASSPNNILLVPTLDIEIVWQTHLLRPEMYRNDCLRLFHRVIDHSLLTDNIGQFLKEQAFIDTCLLYKEQFGEQYCSMPVIKKNRCAVSRYSNWPYYASAYHYPSYSYWDKTHFEFAFEPLSDYENPFSFTEVDVISDSNWLDLYKRFMFETSFNTGESCGTPDDTIDLTVSNLELLKKSYERFLYMAAKYPPRNGSELLHATYAIDIIRHSHMQAPLNYASDCIRLAGYVIDHAPLSSIEVHQVTKPCVTTNNIWKEEFDHDIATDHLYRLPIKTLTDEASKTFTNEVSQMELVD